jgi:hypothetical protein
MPGATSGGLAASERHLSHAGRECGEERWALRRADEGFVATGGRELPAPCVGPPGMAVTPKRMRYCCVEEGVRGLPDGPVKARRCIVSLPPRPETEGCAFRVDEDGFVLESCEGLDVSRSWMRLVEYRRSR